PTTIVPAPTMPTTAILPAATSTAPSSSSGLPDMHAASCMSASLLHPSLLSDPSSS
ncbi:uncharacterized protein J3R85_010749, partial [Psidium guajava]